MVTMTPEQEAIVDQLERLVETKGIVNLLMDVNFLPNMGNNVLVDVEGTLERSSITGRYIVRAADFNRVHFPVGAVNFIFEDAGVQVISLKNGVFEN